MDVKLADLCELGEAVEERSRVVDMLDDLHRAHDVVLLSPLDQILGRAMPILEHVGAGCRA